LGANTAIFSLLDQIILQSLPVERPEELVVLRSPGEFKFGNSSTDDSGGMDFIFSYRVFRELETRAGAVGAMAGFRSTGAVVSFRNQTVNAAGMLVSGGYFPVLGVKPLVGRLISPQDEVDGADQLSDRPAPVAGAGLCPGFVRGHRAGVRAAPGLGRRAAIGGGHTQG
jgi:hypothetical protein